jgi:UDP-hydrolysing UDP-N-acetyl-D-glucosamine 2-epimerase
MRQVPKRTIVVVTSGRCDYGLLYPVMSAIREEPSFILKTLVTGMHLSPEYGSTYRVIEKDGFTIDAKVEMLISADTRVATTKSMGLGLIGYADALENLKPDLIIILGDRFELFAVAQAALIAMIPIAHLVGGDVTEGAFDEAIRHGITKMSHLHFVTNSKSASRVRQMGENPNYIFNVGSPGIDRIHQAKKASLLLTRERLIEKFGVNFLSKNLLITYNPTTLERNSELELKELLMALEKLGNDVGLIFTRPNADPDGRGFSEQLDSFVKEHNNAKVFTSLGEINYYSMIEQVDAVVGNSSSGLYEVPSFKKPTVNIGDRQKGRTSAESVINCKVNSEDIGKAIAMALRLDCSQAINPYGDGKTSARIISRLKEIPDFRILLKKRFYEYEKEDSHEI